MHGTNAAYGEILGVTFAIRHVIHVPGEVYVLTDSQQACQAFLSGHGTLRAARQILKQSLQNAFTTSPRIHLLWTPWSYLAAKQ